MIPKLVRENRLWIRVAGRLTSASGNREDRSKNNKK